MSEKTHNYLRSKSLKISCSEERALEIVRPVVDFTAYILSLTRIVEVPSFESMRDSLMPSKISLAGLLAAKLSKPINPEGLTITNVEAASGGGYFKVSVFYYTGVKNRKDTETVECFNVSLRNENKVLLLDCVVAQKERELGRVLTTEERMEAIAKSTRL